MVDCSILDFKDLLFALVTPIIQWITREMMGRISTDSAEDFIEATITGLGVLGVLYIAICLIPS